jgi:hypothetical protein
MHRIILFFLLSFCALSTITSQEVWEGTAAQIRPAEFTTPGFFAASNSFPKNSTIEIESLETGKRVKVTVLKRIDQSANIFILVSAKAAAALGIGPSEVIRVKCRLTAGSLMPMAGLPDDLPYNPDPDIDPTVAISEMELRSVKIEPAEEPAQAPVEEAETAAEVTEETASPPEAELTLIAPLEEEASTSPDLPESTLPEWTQDDLSRLAFRSPQKKLFMPPREDERFVFIEPPQPPAPEEKGTIAGLIRPGEDRLEEASLELPGVEQEEKPLIEEAYPLTYTSEEGEEIGIVTPEPPLEETPERVVITLEPTEPRPPVEEAAERAPAEAVQAAAAGEGLLFIDKLPKESYFIQLGAYTAKSLALKLGRDLAGTYSVAILPAAGRDRGIIYKVMIGPVNDDESGVLLYNLKSRGFKDAFIQYGE